MAITGPRIYSEMAADGALPAAFLARGSAPPPMAVIAQSVWSGLLVLTGTFEQIVTYTGFAIVLFSGGAVGALLLLRRRHGRPATFAVPGYPLVPIAFVACTILISIASFRYAPGPSLVGVVLIAAGIPLRRFAR
jgi:APA family basic amino acid/polyamine antiporter